MSASTGGISFDRRTRIVTARQGDHHEPAETKKVPKKWLQHQEQVRKVTENLAKSLKDNDQVGIVSYVPSNKTINDLIYSAPEISVLPGTSNEKRRELPESVNKTEVSASSKLQQTAIKTREMEGDLGLANVNCNERVIESLPWEAAGFGNCVQQYQRPARRSFGRRLLECGGYRDS
ncbi:hypothetical protein, partial [Halorientalis salina]|uniref:hypothetical protein n=1 Tax=Halorientalis salina TaxID=2932266 RepID=UPI002022AE86